MSDLTFMKFWQYERSRRSKRTRKRLFEQLVRGLITSGDGGYRPFFGDAEIMLDTARNRICVRPLFRDALTDYEKAADEHLASYWEELVPHLAWAVAEFIDNRRCECGPGCVHQNVVDEFLQLFVEAWNNSDEETV